MALFHLLKIRTSTDMFKNEKCKVTFGLEYMFLFRSKTLIVGTHWGGSNEYPQSMF